MNEALASGEIIREKAGRRSIYWTKTNYALRDAYLEKFPTSLIGKKKLKHVVEYCDQNFSQIISSKIVVKNAIIFGENETKNGTYFGTYSPSCHMKLYKPNKEVVLCPKSDKSEARPKHIPPPSFEKKIDKETLTKEQRSALCETYGLEEVAKREANALAAKVKCREDGHANGKFYNRGFFEVVREYCETERKRKIARRELSQRKKDIKNLSLENIIDIRRNKVMSDVSLKGLVLVDSNGFFIKQNSLNFDDYQLLPVTGISFESEQFDEKLISIKNYISNISRKKSFYAV